MWTIVAYMICSRMGSNHRRGTGWCKTSIWTTRIHVTILLKELAITVRNRCICCGCQYGVWNIRCAYGYTSHATTWIVIIIAVVVIQRCWNIRNGFRWCVWCIPTAMVMIIWMESIFLKNWVRLIFMVILWYDKWFLKLQKTIMNYSTLWIGLFINCWAAQFSERKQK